MGPNGGEGQWRVRVASGEYGPLDLQTVKEWVRERRIMPSDFVYSPESRSWMPASSVVELGAAFSLQGPAPQQIVPPQQADAFVPGGRVLRAAPPYKGVGGWLLFFCIIVVIVGPLATLINIPRTFQMINQLLGPDHPLKHQMVIWTLVDLSMVAFGMVAGIRLWGVKSGAVPLVRVFLVVRLIVFVISTALAPSLRPLQEAVAGKYGIRMDFRLIGVFAFIWGVAWYLIWFMYFRVSKRVMATYGV